MELLKQLYRIYSPSGRERTMRKFLIGHMRRIPGVKVETDCMGNLYATKGVSETYPCIVAHMDQVHEAHSRDFKVIETEDFVFAYSPKHRRQENLGADDKNGLWIGLKCLEKCPVLKMVFFVGEESGCIGSGSARMDFFQDCRFVVEADRKGNEDLVTSIGWTGLCSREFLEATGYGKFGYQETDGLMTDILALKENGLSVSCINLSSGYYEPHTHQEYTVKEDLLNCLDFVMHIIGNCTGVYTHIPEYMENGWIFNEEYEYAQDEIFSMLDMDDTLSLDDLIYMYELYFPHLKRDDFERIYLDYHESDSKGLKGSCNGNEE